MGFTASEVFCKTTDVPLDHESAAACRAASPLKSVKCKVAEWFPACDRRNCVAKRLHRLTLYVFYCCFYKLFYLFSKELIGKNVSSKRAGVAMGAAPIALLPHENSEAAGAGGLIGEIDGLGPLAVAGVEKDGCGRVEVPDGWRGVGKRQKERARLCGPFLFARLLESVRRPSRRPSRSSRAPRVVWSRL